jgi:MFS family permease
VKIGRPRGGLWEHNDFLKLWAGETISVFGSLVGRTALPLTAIFVLDAGSLEVGLLIAADILPGLLFGLVAGVWVDRVRRRPIMIAADLASAAALVTIPVAYAFDALTIEQMFVVALAAGTAHIFFDVAYMTYLPSLVEKEHVLEGNSKMAASWSVAEVGAFSAAGWLVQLLSGPVTVLIDSVSFLVSAAFIGSIKKPEEAPTVAEQREPMFKEIRDGIGAIWHDPVLRAIAGSGVIIDFSFRMFGAVFLVYVTQDLGFEPGLLGLTFAVGGASSFVGAMLAGRSARAVGVGPAMVFGLLFMGGSMLFVPAATDASMLALAFLVAQQVFGDGAYTVYDVNAVTLRQSITPAAVLGRVNAGMRFSGLAAMLLGALAGGVLGEFVGERLTLMFAACGLFLAGVWLMVSPVWGTRRAAVVEVEPSAAS